MNPLLLRLFPVQINILPETGRKHADPPARLDLTAVVADVLNTGIEIRGDPVRTGRVRTVVKSRRGNRHRKSIQTIAFFVQLVAEDHYILAFRFTHGDGIDRLRQSFLPARIHLLGAVTTHTEIIDLRLPRQGADDNGHGVMFALRVGHVLKQPRFAIFFG